MTKLYLQQLTQNKAKNNKNKNTLLTYTFPNEYFIFIVFFYALSFDFVAFLFVTKLHFILNIQRRNLYSIVHNYISLKLILL